MQVEIIPAILQKKFKEIEKQLSLVRPEITGSKMVQLDVSDGHFARSRTWPYHDEDHFNTIVKEEKGLPYWEEFDFQFDLMINHPDEKVLDYVRAGASHIVVHARSPGAVEAMQKLVDLREEGGAFSTKVGVALPPDAQPEELEPFEAQFDFVQVMGISNIGYQGEPFDKHALYLVERLRKRYAELLIQVDGGVSMENANMLANAGANRLVVGSAIFKQDNPAEAVAALRAEANRR